MSVVRVQRGYKYRLYPNKYQKHMLNKTFGCVQRFGAEGKIWGHGKLMKELQR